VPIEFSSRVGRLPDYPVAGGYSLPEDVAMLASNESPWPPAPEVLQAAAAAAASSNRYPDPSNSALRAALARRYDVPANRIAVGNGSVDLLMAAGEALLEPGAEVVYAWPSFSVYPHLPAASGATALAVPLTEDFKHDLPAMLREITVATRLVIVNNPNNPTSTALPLDEIAAFIAEVPPSVCVILDEAYIEFNLLDDPDASVELLEKHPNLILLRTFSKAYGLAALRVGYALCGTETFVKAVATAAAIEALKHTDHVAERVEKTVMARAEVEEGLRAMGIEPAESQANFCWFDLPEGAVEADVIAGLRERGVLVRQGSALGREGALRVTYGTPEQNERFLTALRELL
jgi:histidinol-phosphate aminotransferase